MHGHHPEAGDSGVWLATLATLGRQFEAERARFPDLFHSITLARPGDESKFKGYPHFGCNGRDAIFANGRPHYAVPAGGGYAYRADPRAPLDARPTPHDFMYSHTFFGCGEDERAIWRAIEAFRILAERAWGCLPEPTRRDFVAEPYLDPTGVGGGSTAWLLLLYAVAWRGGAASGLNANRAALVVGKKGHDPYDIENIIQGQMAVPKEWADKGVRLPPDALLAALQPDVFQASQLATRFILRACRQAPGRAAPTPAAERQSENGGEWQRAARMFRSEPFHPGALVVVRPGSFAHHAVSDDAYNPSIEKLVGIALWGAMREQPGPTGPPIGGLKSPMYAPLATGEALRPGTDIGTIDAWIARADALRKLLTEAAQGGGTPPPPPNAQLAAAIGEIAWRVRETALRLLATAPAGARGVLSALPAVADCENPSAEQLDAAIRELMAHAGHWARPLTELFLAVTGLPSVARAAADLLLTIDRARRQAWAGFHGEPSEVVVEGPSLTEAMGRLRSESRASDPADPVSLSMIEETKSAIARVEAHVGKVKAALQRHGPEMNRALSPGTLRWTGDAHGVLDAMLACLPVLRIGLGEPRAVLEQPATDLQSLAERAEVLVRDVRGVLQQAPIERAPGESGGTPEPKPKRRRRRRQLALTKAEQEAFDAVKRNRGCMAAAARQLGKDRKTVRENYARAEQKTKAMFPSGRSVRARSRLPTDRRGQEDVADETEGGGFLGGPQ